MARCTHRSFYVAGVKVRSGEARTRLGGQWVAVVTHNAGPGQINVQELHHGAALQLPDGLVLAFDPARTRGRRGRDIDVAGMASTLALHQRRLYAHRLAQQPCGPEALEVVLNHAPAPKSLHHAARISPGSADAVFAKYLQAGADNAGDAIVLVPHLTDVALLMGVYRNGNDPRALGAIKRIRELGGYANVRDEHCAMLYALIPDTSGVQATPVGDAWGTLTGGAHGAVAAARILAVSIIDNMDRADAVDALEFVTQEAARRAGRGDLSLQRFTSGLLLSFAVDQRHQPVAAQEHAERLLAVLQRLGIDDVPAHAWVVTLSESVDPGTLAGLEHEAGRLKIGFTSSPPWSAANWAAAPLGVAKGARQWVDSASIWPPAHVVPPSHVALRAKAVRESPALSSAVLNQIATREHPLVQREALARLDDPAAWITAIRGHQHAALLAEKAPQGVLEILAADLGALGNQRLVAVLYERGALSARDAWSIGDATVQALVADTTRDEGALAEIVAGSDTRMVLRAGMRTKDLATLEQAALAVDGVGGDIVAERDKAVRCAVTARQLADAGDVATARGLVQAIRNHDLLWDLQSHPVLAPWATARLMGTKD